MEQTIDMEEEKQPDYSKLVDGVSMVCALILMLFFMIFIFYSGMWYAESHTQQNIVSPLPERK